MNDHHGTTAAPDAEATRRQRRRSLWLGLGLAGLAVTFYLSIIVKIGTVGL